MVFQKYHKGLILLLLLLLLLSAITGYATGKPKQLARILYGQHAEQIGANWAGGLGEGDNPYDLGPRGFAVDDKGDIYLGDYLNGAVKRFSPKGQLLASTEGMIDIQSFLVSPTGNIYVCSEERPSEVVHFDARGHRVWARTFSEIVPDDVLASLEKEYGVNFPSGFSTKITDGPKGTIMLQAIGKLPNGRTGIKLGILINEKGEYVEARPYFGLEAGGIWWQYQIDFTQLADGVAPPITVNTFIEDGTIKQTVMLQTDNDRYKHVYEDSEVWAIPDQHNGTLFVTTLRLAEPIKIKQQAFIRRDYIVDRYDGNGIFLERFQFPSSPFINSVEDIVINKGGLYFLRYDSKGLDVMVYKE